MKQKMRFGQGRTKKQIEVNEQVGAMATLLFVTFFAIFVIFNALANG